MVESTGPLGWRRARRCATNNCVEVAKDGDHILIRGSRSPDVPPLRVDAAEWAAFLGGVRDGDFEFD